MGLVDANRTGKAPEESVTPQDLRVAIALRGVSRPHHPRPECVAEELVAEADSQGWAAVVLHGVYLPSKFRLGLRTRQHVVGTAQYDPVILSQLLARDEIPIGDLDSATAGEGGLQGQHPLPI